METFLLNIFRLTTQRRFITAIFINFPTCFQITLRTPAPAKLDRLFIIGPDNISLRKRLNGWKTTEKSIQKHLVYNERPVRVFWSMKTRDNTTPTWIHDQNCYEKKKKRKSTIQINWKSSLIKNQNGNIWCSDHHFFPFICDFPPPCFGNWTSFP